MSKTQLAYEAALRGDAEAVHVLTCMCIVKCRGIWPPFSADPHAESQRHAFRRRWTNRYLWIDLWVRRELRKPQHPKATGAGLVNRCRWKLQNTIRDASRARKREERGPRTLRRADYRSQESLLDVLSTLPPVVDPVLRDLWERLLDAYPDWEATTNRRLAAVLGVHENVIASRRHALALLQHAQASGQQIAVLRYGLRLKIGKVRKTDIHRIESQTGVLQRSKIVSTPRQVGAVQLMDWHPGSTKGAASGTPFLMPIFASLEPTAFVRQPRCPHIFRDGMRCVYAASKCSDHRDKSPI